MCGPRPLLAGGVKHTFGATMSTLERAKGFEPSTPTLARLCSTPELHPHPACPREVGLRVPQTTMSTLRGIGGSEGRIVTEPPAPFPNEWERDAPSPVVE
jgi:hypothetical protein